MRTIRFPTSLVPSETVKKKCRLDRSVKWTSPLERHVATSLAGYCSRRAAARCCCSAFWRAGKRPEQHENLLLLSFSLFTECADEAKLFFLSTTKQKNWVRPTTKYKGTRRRRKSLPVQSEESAVLRHFFQFQDAGLELTNPFLALYDRSTPR